MNKTDYVPTFFAPMVSLYLIYAGEVAWEGVVFQTRFKETSTGISSTNIIWQRDMDTRMVRGLLSQRRIYRVVLNSSRYFWLSIRSFRTASDYCRDESDCRGITKENGWFYTHSTAQIAQNQGTPSVTSWIKGFLWAGNFVPRVSWGAVSPGPGLPGNMDPTKIDGVSAPHTVGPQCFTQTECKSKMRDFQLKDMMDGSRLGC